MSRPDAPDDRPSLPDGADPIEELRTLYDERLPDPELEEQLVAHLRGRARGAPPVPPPGRSRSAWPRAWTRVAAAAAIFMAGWWGGGRLGGADRPTGGADRGGVPYMIVLLESDEYRPEQTPGARAVEYAAWARSVADSGVTISGAELVPPRWSFQSDGTGSESGVRVSGYFLLTLAEESPDRIQSIAESHPHLQHGGRLQVARVGG